MRSHTFPVTSPLKCLMYCHLLSVLYSLSLYLFSFCCHDTLQLFLTKGHMFTITAGFLWYSLFRTEIILLLDQDYNFPGHTVIQQDVLDSYLASLKDPELHKWCLHYTRKEFFPWLCSKLKYHNHLAVIVPCYPKRRFKEGFVVFLSFFSSLNPPILGLLAEARSWKRGWQADVVRKR